MASGSGEQSESADEQAILEHYRTLVEMAPDVIYSLSAENGTFTSLSPAFEEITGWRIQDWLSKPFREIIHPDDLPVALEKFQQGIRGESPPPYELRIRTKSGEYVVGEFRSIPMFENGRVVGKIGIARDITERKRGQEERRRTEEELKKLAAIIESSDDAIFTKTLDGTITNWNPGAERLYHYSAEEVFGQPVSILVPSDRPDELPSIMERLRRGERIEPFETVRLTKEGRGVDVSMSISPVRDAEGKIVAASIIARDIAERKEAQRRSAFLAEASQLLAESLDYETTLARVARLAVPGIADWCTIDIVGEDDSVSQLAVEHVDSAKIQLVREFQERYPYDPGAEHGTAEVFRSGRSEIMPEIPDELIEAALPDTEAVEFVRRLGLRSMMCVPLSARGRTFGAMTFVSAESGKHYGAEELALAEDLAHRASVAVDNARLFRQAQEALRLREEFLSIASHELKTPLTSLQLQTQILQRFVREGSLSSLAPERAKDAVESLARQIKRLTSLVNDLLDVSRISAGRLELEPQQVELVSLVNEVVDRFGHDRTSLKSPISITAAAQVEGYWDRFRIDEVVTNLLSNALKYGAGEPIEIGVDSVGDVARITVTDHGIGIAPADQPRVFERFERLETTRGYGGIGMGLYIVRQIVEAHGGTVEVESETGKGSTFTVELPKSRVEAREPAPAA